MRDYRRPTKSAGLVEDGLGLLGLANQEPQREKGHFRLLYVALFAAFALIAIRLWYLQGIRGEYFLELSRNNRIRERDVAAPRGILFDRKGRILVDSFPRYDVTVTPEDVDDVDQTVAYLSVLLQMDAGELATRIRTLKRRNPFEPIVLKQNVAREELAAVVTHSSELPGVEITVHALRHYLEGPLLASLLGYVGEIGKEELERRASTGYRPGDLIGMLGIERRLEDELRGVNGVRRLVVDAQGRELSSLGEDAPKPGHNVVLTLDAEVQRRAEEAMGDEDGSVVALDVHTGEVLAWVSKPTFDPNAFSDGITSAAWHSLMSDKRKPMLNRPIQGRFPPGSTFKIVMALAALEEGIMRPENAVFCPGGLQFGGRFFRCWRHSGHGSVDLHRAIVESCDTYFYRVGIDLGVDRIAKWSNHFGLGLPTGIDILDGRQRPVEKAGLIPSTTWKRATFKSDWYPGETLSVAIGQGYVSVTPLQQAVMAAVIANGGTRYRPQFVRSFQTYDGHIEKQIEPEVLDRFEAHARNLDVVRAGLRDVVEGERGTGKKARIPGVTVAGKTGTAQVRGLRKGEDEDHIEKQYRDHAWFVCYAPADHPEIAVAALVEHGGHGGSAAAPVARAVIEAYLESKQQPDAVIVPRRDAPPPAVAVAASVDAEPAVPPAARVQRTTSANAAPSSAGAPRASRRVALLAPPANLVGGAPPSMVVLGGADAGEEGH